MLHKVKENKYEKDVPTFVFNIKDNLFERFVEGNMNFVSMYYLEHGENIDDIDSKTCYDIALDRFNYDNVKTKYFDYFNFVSDVLNGNGFYEGI